MRNHVVVKGGFISSIALLLTLTFASAGLADSTADDFLKEAKKTVTEVSVADAKAAVDAGKAVFMDCRTEKEFKRGHIPGAVHLERGLVEFQVAKKFPDKSQYIIIYCKSGGRSCLCDNTMLKMGYTNVASMAGGWKAWVKAGYPVE